MPALSPEMFTETVSVPVPPPQEGETPNQAPRVTEALQDPLQYDVVAVVTVTVWLAGLASPSCAVKVSEVELSAIVGDLTVSVTCTSKPVPVAL